MTVEKLIEELKKIDPKSEVYLHNNITEPVFMICEEDDKIWLESKNDIIAMTESGRNSNISKKLLARMDEAFDDGEDELDVYRDMLEDGINVDMVRKYLGDTQADHMQEFCEDHGLIDVELHKYYVGYTETYRDTYEVIATSYKQAEDLIREKILNGDENGPEEIIDSGSDEITRDPNPIKLYKLTKEENSFLIPNTLHVVKNDQILNNLDLSVLERLDTEDFNIDDFEAGEMAKKDGIKFINNMHSVYKNVYVDTPENRKIIKEYLQDHTSDADNSEKKTITVK